MAELSDANTLLFDCFGTILDLGGSLVGPIAEFLEDRPCECSAEQLWAQWRARQRIEQYQDTLLMTGHSGYLTTSRRALLYVLRVHRIDHDPKSVEHLMEAWWSLTVFPDVPANLPRLKQRFRLVLLSNGERYYLDHLARERIRFVFDDVVSVDSVGAFKPAPVVYRHAARVLSAEPHQLAMVSANSFDLMGARACGLWGLWVRRYDLPFEETPYQPSLVVGDFDELTIRLGCSRV